MTTPTIPSRYDALDPRDYRWVREPTMTLSEATSVLGWISHAAKQD